MKIVFSDFDGTLTDHGQLGASFLELLHTLKKNAIPLIIVSGRSASWGHFLLTHFDLDCVIMEGGGIILSKKNGLIHHDVLVSNSDLDQLHSAYQDTLKIKGVIASADNLGRLTDRALEAEKMQRDDLEKVTNFLYSKKINFSQSNIHLNLWCGEVSKAKAIEKVLAERGISESSCCYFGDSLNDESVFAYMSHTIGVSNINSVLSKLKHKPKMILTGEQNQEIHGVNHFIKDLLASK